jgi:hypothetical protein
VQTLEIINYFIDYIIQNKSIALFQPWLVSLAGFQMLFRFEWCERVIKYWEIGSIGEEVATAF